MAWMLMVCNVEVQGRMQVVQGRMQVVQARMQVVQARMQVVQARMQVVQGRMQVVQGRMQVVQGRMQSGARQDASGARQDASGARQDASGARQDASVVWECVHLPHSMIGAIKYDELSVKHRAKEQQHQLSSSADEQEPAQKKQASEPAPVVDSFRCPEWIKLAELCLKSPQCNSMKEKHTNV
eukprot:282354-Pelagomonas_calceolata.AAC.4